MYVFYLWCFESRYCSQDTQDPVVQANVSRVAPHLQQGIHNHVEANSYDSHRRSHDSSQKLRLRKQHMTQNDAQHGHERKYSTTTHVTRENLRGYEYSNGREFCTPTGNDYHNPSTNNYRRSQYEDNNFVSNPSSHRDAHKNTHFLPRTTHINTQNCLMMTPLHHSISVVLHIIAPLHHYCIIVLVLIVLMTVFLLVIWSNETHWMNRVRISSK